MRYPKIYKGLALIADPIYQYASFTVPSTDFPEEKTEKDLLDSPFNHFRSRNCRLQKKQIWLKDDGFLA
jgi:hypothetical protein